MPENEEWTEDHGRKTVDEPTVSFMRRHFEAAYNGSYENLGRFRPEPPTDPSIALSVADNGSQTHSRTPQTEHRCRSGDGCDRIATMGRFGPMWCDHHGEELE